MAPLKNIQHGRQALNIKKQEEKLKLYWEEASVW